MPAQVAGDIHHFADKVQVGAVEHGHGLGGQLAGVDATEGNLGSTVAFGAGGFDGPLAELAGNLVDVAVAVTL